MVNRSDESRPDLGVVYVWASPERNAVPDRVAVESCTTCAAWVPLAEFDQHGRWHAAQGV